MTSTHFVGVRIPLVASHRPVTELAYVFDSKPKFCGFDSRLGDYLKHNTTVTIFHTTLSYSVMVARGILNPTV